MSKIAGRWIKDGSINGDNIKYDNNQSILARNAANTADLSIVKANASDKAEFGIEPIYSGSINNPTSLVTKQFVEDALLGVRDPKDAARAMSVGANVALTAAHPLTLDGVSLVFGNRVLLIDQTAGAENGLYEYSDAGGGDYELVRPSDFDSSEKVTQGASVDVVEGTSLGKTRWIITTADPITLETTSLTFIEVPLASSLVSFKEEAFVLVALDISNGYVDLANEAEEQSILVWPIDGPIQKRTTDFTVSVVSNKTRITFAGDLAAELVATDTLVVNYSHF